MTLTELRYIVALARERHFGRAADKCHVSQPTLSVALKKVEHRIGTLLFERTSADVRLTPLGEQVVAQAERILEEAATLDEIVVLGKDPLVGPLRLGVIYTIAPYLLPRLIPALNHRAPQMPLYLQENFTVRLAEQLRRGELDVAVLALPFSEPGIVTRAVYDEPFRVAMPACHHLAQETRIHPDRLAGEHLLMLGQGNCFRDQVVQACPHLRQPGGLEGALEGSSLETLRHMVASGAGISVVPASAVESWPRDDALMSIRPFTDPVPMRRVVLAWRVTYPRPLAIDCLREAILAAPPPGVYRLP
jgi:LysR family hydrogen peroxide-inducible transcriptional activator